MQFLSIQGTGASKKQWFAIICHILREKKNILPNGPKYLKEKA